MKKPNRFEGILFDFDGVLGMTMEDHYHAWKAAFTDHGVTISETDYYPLEGMGLPKIAARLCRQYGLPESLADDIVRKKKDNYIQKSSFSFYPGVPEIIAEFKKRGLKLGIVTASVWEQLLAKVPKPFLDQFHSIITNDLDIKTKPNPDPYLAGLEKLGIPAEHCLVVENAPLGIQSAHAAGLYCIAITSTNTREVLQEADEIIARFQDLLKSPPLSAVMRGTYHKA